MAHTEREKIAKPRFDSRPSVKYELREDRSLTTLYARVRLRDSAVPLAWDKHRSAMAIRFTTELSVFCASVDVKNTKRFFVFFAKIAREDFSCWELQKACYFLDVWLCPLGCQLHSCERLPFGVAQWLRQFAPRIYDGAALLLRSFLIKLILVLFSAFAFERPQLSG